ncbi:MAG: DNA-binding response regulator, NarL/FixJ family, containings and domain [Pedosphaera sp.]|nr:DNA-binding response regulator, NarL/FixJ family, containings and domain [Pedosphaera sp.]
MITKIRLLIVDDHLLIRLGLVTIFSDQPDITVVGEASSGRMAAELFAKTRPDVVLLDLKMPGLSGVETIKLLQEQSAAVCVVVLTTLDQEEEIFRALEAGAQGYLLKDMRKEDLVEAIRAVHRGERWIAPLAGARLAERLVRKELSDRELEIVKLLVHGKSNKEIASALSLSEDTIKWHMKNLLEKLGTHDRTQAAVIAIQRGIVKI